MNQVEVYIFLHSIANGVTIVSSQDTLGHRRMLPSHEVELIPDPQIARRCVIRMPTWLAMAHNLMPASKSTFIGTSTKGNVPEMDGGGIGLGDLSTKTFDYAKDVNTKDGVQQVRVMRQVPEQAQTTRFRPARDGQIGNEAGFLAGHRARSQVEQLAGELADEGHYNPGE